MHASSAHRSGAPRSVEHVFDALYRVVEVLQQTSREVERDLDVTSAQLLALAHIRNAPSLSVDALGARTMTDQSTVSVVVRRLVRRGLVRKRRSARDGRRVELRLTSSGASLLGQARDTIRLPFLQAAAEMTPADRDALEQGLRALARVLGPGASAVSLLAVYATSREAKNTVGSAVTHSADLPRREPP